MKGCEIFRYRESDTKNTTIEHDLLNLAELHESTLLDMIRKRYLQGKGKNRDLKMDGVGLTSPHSYSQNRHHLYIHWTAGHVIESIQMEY